MLSQQDEHIDRCERGDSDRLFLAFGHEQDVPGSGRYNEESDDTHEDTEYSFLQV